MPKVSVVMAVHNGMPYLPAAMDSVLRQTFTDFEFIIVDDASSDGSLAVLQSYRHKRLRIVRNSRQLGLPRSLNRAIDHAEGKYIARMDHDDISLPRRFEMQVDFLERHPTIGVVGTWAATLGRVPRQTWKPPLEHSEIRSELIFNPALIHSSILFRKKLFSDHALRYDPRLKRAQDYALWCRAAESVRFSNIARVLLLYRIHGHQVGKRYASEQLKMADEIRIKQVRKLGLSPTKFEAKLHNDLSRWRFSGSLSGLRTVDKWLDRLWQGNAETKFLSTETFRKSLAARWVAASRSSISGGMKTWHVFRQSQFSKSVPALEKTILWTKCLSREWGWRNG